MFQASPSPAMPHLVEAGALALAVLLKAVWDHRLQKKHTTTTRVERNAELDTRLNSIRSAISLAQQSTQDVLTRVESKVDVVSHDMIGVKLEVAGLVERERSRLESDAALGRARKR